MPSISLTVRSYCTAALVLICASASAQNSIERVNGSIGRYIFTDIYRKQDEVRYNGKNGNRSSLRQWELQAKSKTQEDRIAIWWAGLLDSAWWQSEQERLRGKPVDFSTGPNPSLARLGRVAQEKATNHPREQIVLDWWISVSGGSMMVPGDPASSEYVRKVEWVQGPDGPIQMTTFGLTEEMKAQRKVKRDKWQASTERIDTIIVFRIYNPGPRPFEALAVAEDQEHQKNDHFTYRMRIHQPWEYVRPRAAFGPDYLKYCGAWNPLFINFPADQFRPKRLGSPDYVNDGPLDSTFFYQVTNTTTITNGWAFEVNGSAGLPVKFAEILFGGVFKRNGSISVATATQTGYSHIVPARYRLVFWVCPRGKVDREIVAFYHTSGFVRDSDQFVIKEYSEELRVRTQPMNDPVLEPI